MKPGVKSAWWGLGATALIAALVVTGWKLFRPAVVEPLPELRRDELTLREGRLCRLGETSPFTGVMVEFGAAGLLQSRSSVSNGLLEGISEGWYTNGHVQVREHFVAGVSHGPRLKWHANGQQLSEANIVQGQIEGLFRRWHEDGSLAEEIQMKSGQPDGAARSYYASGFVKAEARLRAGEVLEQRFWSDGEQAGPKQAASPSVSAPNREP
ncbi:MAG: toxin-antitoxin system YwqK family antitoxin [Verrucomicrobia bacterium]|nr:toxin-antitoxin system YwqK family antitoxin [Verrucomicrobiota bacterium]